jgi:hypothetical protein
MPETAAPRRRRWPHVVVLCLVLIAGSALLIRHLLRAERMTAMVVAQTRSLLDADLQLGAVGTFEFSPDLRLRLARPSLKADAAARAMLSADSIDVIVPWHTLWSDRYDIERIELVRPVLDLDALSAWSAKRSGGAAPDVRFTLHVTDGSIVSAGVPVAAGIDVDLANSADVYAWLDQARASHGVGAQLPPVRGTASARSLQVGDTRIEGVRIEISDDAAAPPATGGP